MSSYARSAVDLTVDQLRGERLQILPVHLHCPGWLLWAISRFFPDTLSTNEWTFPCTCQVDPSASLLGRVYGYFTHRQSTSPPLPRFPLFNRLRLPSSPAHCRRRFLGDTAFGCASDTIRQSDY